MAFSYYSPISINAAQVPSTQTDFPVLVNLTDARFKTVGNGGHVQNSSGFDIRPYTDSTLTTAITGYELERHNASTGEVIMWVKVASLTSSSTPFVLAYGDSGISTDGSSSTTWSNSFLGVYHLKDGTTLDVNSATGSNNGTNHSCTAVTGQIDGAAGFATNQYIDLGSGIGSISDITYSAWVKATSFANAYNEVIGQFLAIGPSFTLFTIKSNGKLACFVITATGTRSYDGTGSNTLSTATWYHVALTYASVGTSLSGYVNGSLDANTFTGATNSLNTGGPTYIGNDAQGTGFFWNGTIDEARIASVARSADWLATEYNNQFAPGTFETLGSEGTPTAPGGTSNFLMFMPS